MRTFIFPLLLMMLLASGCASRGPLGSYCGPLPEGGAVSAVEEQMAAHQGGGGVEQAGHALDRHQLDPCQPAFINRFFGLAGEDHRQPVQEQGGQAAAPVERFAVAAAKTDTDKPITPVTYTITFDSDGTYKSVTPVPAISPAANLIEFTPTGATKVAIAPDFSSLTQYGNETTVQATSQNGYAAGTLDSTSIDPSGTIVGRFTNGQSKNLAQVALATFNNPAGLNKSGTSLYTKSNTSGVAQVGPSGSGGRGSFTPGALEMSNVDLAQEFSNMIITQRGFQANSKIITTTDQMLEELSNLKR